MKQFFPVLALVCLLENASAQQIPTLSVGDPLPDITIGNLLNHPRPELNLSEFRGQWLIIDFWATWCSPCISMFQKTDSLEKEFHGSLRFLAVTYEPKQEVEQLFSRLKKLQPLRPLISYEDTRLRAIFPHKNLPHYVWIDPSGRVAAITGFTEITREHIAQKMAGYGNPQSPAQLNLAQDARPSFTRHDRLVNTHPLVAASNPLYTACLSGYLPDINGFTYVPPGRILAVNIDRRSLYALAFGEGKIFLGNNRTFLEVEHPEELTTRAAGKDYREWLEGGRGFSVDIQVPASMVGTEFLVMQDLLAKAFPQYHAFVETRSIPVLALVRTTTKDKLATKGGRTQVEVKPYGITLQNAFLNTMVGHLQVKYLSHLKTPLVNLTGYEGRVDLQLDASLSEVEELREALQAYGLDLQVRTEEIEVLVIRDR